MGRAVEAAGGRVDKFIGDGVMALFWIERGTEAGRREAIAAARLMSAGLDELKPSATGKSGSRSARIAELFEFAPRPDLHLTSVAARDDLKIGKLHLEGDSTAANAGALAISPPLPAISRSASLAAS